MKFRRYLYPAVCFLLLLSSTLWIVSGSSPTASRNRNARRSSSRRSNSNSRRSNSNRRSSRGHCNDSAPANPSRCNVNQSFVIGCNLPFDGGVSHDIDEHCPNQGCATRASDLAQNRIKNNLCATGTPVEISFTTMDRLQRAVDRMVSRGQISYGSGGPPQPADRAKLHNLATVDSSGNPVRLSEGDLVTIDAFVLDAKHDDSFPLGFSGEGVNCKNSLLEWNDIHVALGRTASVAECTSVTAEIIPHFRPAVWERFDSNSCTKRHVTNPLPVKGIRVRITGQLFFDGSHVPSTCSAPSSGNPSRRSVWEIHPVYRIEVFNGSTFVPLEEWAANQH